MGLPIRAVRAAANAAILLTLMFAHPAAAQNGTVTGTVTDDSGAALASAEVRIEGLKIHALTDDRGRFELTGVPPGTHTLKVLLLGYESTTRSVIVIAGAATEVNFKLVQTPIPMEQVEVVVGSRARHTAADELAVPVDVYGRE